MKTIWLILISVALGSLGQVILKLGSNKLGTISFSISSLVPVLLRLLKTPEIVLGLLLFGTSFLLWIKVLTRSELSYAYPMVSIGYIIVVILSYFLLDESFSWNKLMGIAIIVAGVWMINK
ncbi:SMR family transporter [Paenibacillus vulneris]|uniref:EamA family transporter n=1 Tax=Paenibacillus vulneris TaxID=1133364 RepID=A0ABW3UVD4_9BACL|nr:MULTISPECIES: EamA family transporter [unclassified Paenibacillus]MBE1443059.1 multidrug transporter EmrE-like cation transporter [Paenibacillus sp. OAS669]